MTSMKDAILRIVSTRERLDDEEIADILGIPPYQASVLLREMERDGIISRETRGEWKS